jgi:hypothetical protein
VQVAPRVELRIRATQIDVLALYDCSSFNSYCLPAGGQMIGYSASAFAELSHVHVAEGIILCQLVSVFNLIQMAF